MPSWTHPSHSRGIRSPTLFGSHIRGQLTNRQIDRYVKAGYYGTELQTEALSRDKKKRKKESQSSIQKKAIAALMKLLK